MVQLAAEHYIFDILHTYLSLQFFICHGVEDMQRTVEIHAARQIHENCHCFNDGLIHFFYICLLEILEMYLFTHDNQFDFKSKHLTDISIFTMKSVLCSLAFSMPIKLLTESITGLCLEILIKLKVPLLFVRLLMFWYQRPQMCVKWEIVFPHGSSTSRD